MSEKKDQVKVPNDAALAGIGEAYYKGIGVPVNYTEAFRYYRKAAAMGNVSALSRLGFCYEYGRGTKMDLAKALSCYEDAADKGDIRATCKIGDFYRSGKRHLIEMDAEKASTYYVKALELAQQYGTLWNLPEVYLRMADCLLNGIGMEKNVADAYDFYCSSCDGFLNRMESGDRDCQELLDQAEAGAAACEKLLGLPDGDRADDYPA